VSKLGVPCGLIIIAALAAFLSGCTFERQNSEGGDIAAPEFVPPQLPAAAQTPAVIRLEPATQQLGVGATTTVEIRVDGVSDLFAIDLWLQFNPNLLQVQDMNPNQEGIQIQLGDFLPAGFVATNEADNVTGDIFLTLTQVSPGGPVSGSGLLATITFQATAVGTSQLAFTQNDLTTNQGQAIAVTAQSGQIIIAGEAGTPSAEATATETPVSPEPTATMTTVSDQVTPTLTPTSTPILPPTSSPPQQPVPPSEPGAGEPTATLVAPIQSQPPVTSPPSPNQQPSAGPVLTQVPPGATTGFCFRVRTEHSLREVVETIRMEKGIEVNPHHINIANDLYPPGYIFIQQVLFIPTEMGHGPNFLIVEQNNTPLSQIAEQCFLPLDFVAQVNKVPENIILQAGDVVEIPRPPFPPPSRYRYPQSVFPGPYY
jgi:hypothetical protein